MSRTRVSVAAAVLVASVACACGPSREAPAEDGPRQPGGTRVESAATGTGGVLAPECWIREGSQALDERASALDSTSVALAAGEVKVCYGRPGAKGREIIGALVPYDVPWRFGANEATAIYLPAAGTVAGVAIDSGWVSLYAVPAEGPWEIAVNAEPRRWGRDLSAAVRSGDVGSAMITPVSLADPVELLTFRLERASPTAATLVFEWERTRLEIPITLEAGVSAAG